jgi:hypothetical protein
MPRARLGSRGATTVALLAFGAPFLLGCRGGAIVVPRQHDIDEQIDKMRASARPFYFAGREFNGLPLTAAKYEDWRDGGLFAYGTCTIPPGQDGGCAPPAQIQIFRFDPGQWGRAVGCHRLHPLLGVPTVRHDGLVLLSKGAVVKIYARNRVEDRRLALSLRSIELPNEPIRRLPMPTRAARLLLASVCR